MRGLHQASNLFHLISFHPWLSTPQLQTSAAHLQFLESSTVARCIVSKQEARVCDLENKLEFQRGQVKRFEVSTDRKSPSSFHQLGRLGPCVTYILRKKVPTSTLKSSLVCPIGEDLCIMQIPMKIVAYRCPLAS